MYSILIKNIISGPEKTYHGRKGGRRVADHVRKDATLSVLRGLATAVLLTLVGMLILAALVVWAALSDSALVALNQTLKLAAIAAGVVNAVRPGGRHGLALGGCVGLVYIALGYGLCALTGTALVTARMLVIEMAMGLVIGALCGVLVANLPARPGKAGAR